MYFCYLASLPNCLEKTSLPDAEEDATIDVGEGQMADDGGQCFETTVRWDSPKELDPFMDSELANEKLTVTMGYIYLSLKRTYLGNH